MEHIIKRNYAMFTEKGNAEVRSLVVTIKTALRVGFISTAQEILNGLQAGLTKLAEQGHREVWDTAVQDELWSEVFIISEYYGVKKDDFFVK